MEAKEFPSLIYLYLVHKKFFDLKFYFSALKISFMVNLSIVLIYNSLKMNHNKEIV